MKGMWVGYDVGCTMGLTCGHGAWQIDRQSNGSMWNSYSFQPVGQWMSYSFTDVGAEGCCRSLNALLTIPCSYKLLLESISYLGGNIQRLWPSNIHRLILNICMSCLHLVMKMIGYHGYHWNEPSYQICWMCENNYVNTLPIYHLLLKLEYYKASSIRNDFNYTPTLWLLNQERIESINTFYCHVQKYSAPEGFITSLYKTYPVWSVWQSPQVRETTNGGGNLLCPYLVLIRVASRMTTSDWASREMFFLWVRGLIYILPCKWLCCLQCLICLIVL